MIPDFRSRRARERTSPNDLRLNAYGAVALSFVVRAFQFTRGTFAYQRRLGWEKLSIIPFDTRCRTWTRGVCQGRRNRCKPWSSMVKDSEVSRAPGPRIELGRSELYRQWWIIAQRGIEDIAASGGGAVDTDKQAGEIGRSPRLVVGVSMLVQSGHQLWRSLPAGSLSCSQYHRSFSSILRDFSCSNN